MGYFAGFKRINIILVLMAVILASSVMGEDKVPTQSLDWMAGNWCAESSGTSVEEVWLPPRGGLLVGLGRTHTANGTVGFEFLRIAVENGVQNYIAQPGGDPPTHFARTDGGENWVRFEMTDKAGFKGDCTCGAVRYRMHRAPLKELIEKLARFTTSISAIKEQVVTG